jgi:plasmid stability protein
MPNISVRKLDRRTYDRLRRRAAKHGVSMEEEIRQILLRAVSAPEKIGDIFLKYFGPQSGIHLEIPEQRTPHEPMDFK